MTYLGRKKTLWETTEGGRSSLITLGTLNSVARLKQFPSCYSFYASSKKFRQIFSASSLLTLLKFTLYENDINKAPHLFNWESSWVKIWGLMFQISPGAKKYLIIERKTQSYKRLQTCLVLTQIGKSFRWSLHKLGNICSKDNSKFLRFACARFRFRTCLRNWKNYSACFCS